jgi:hypothetical protein
VGFILCGSPSFDDLIAKTMTFVSLSSSHSKYRHGRNKSFKNFLDLKMVYLSLDYPESSSNRKFKEVHYLSLLKVPLASTTDPEGSKRKS